MSDLAESMHPTYLHLEGSWSVATERKLVARESMQP